MLIANSCFGRCWWYPALISHSFVSISVLLVPVLPLSTVSRRWGETSQLQEHVLLAKPVAVSVLQLHHCCHRAVVAASWPQDEQKHWVHLCRRCPKEAFCWVLPLWTMWGSPILLLQDRLCPRSPPWGISNGCRLLSWRKTVLFHEICREKGRPWFLSLTPLGCRYLGSGFALSTRLTQRPHRALVSPLTTPAVGLLMWETPCQWKAFFSQLPSLVIHVLWNYW